jgi:hypothetical protein
VKVIARMASISNMKVFVKARGWNILPSIPVSRKTGRKEATTTIVE